jgi:hypothetical protein
LKRLNIVHATREEGQFRHFWFCPCANCFGSYRSDFLFDSKERALEDGAEEARWHHLSTHAKPVVIELEEIRESDEACGGGLRVFGFAWYPLFDCAGWNCLLLGSRWKRDPQGIFSCGSKWERIATELTDLYAKVAGGARSHQLPAYEFTSTHDRTLAALKRQMKWSWQEQ